MQGAILRDSTNLVLADVIVGYQNNRKTIDVSKDLASALVSHLVNQHQVRATPNYMFV